MTLDPACLVRALRDVGVREFAGVPCSVLDPIVTVAERESPSLYVPASVEGEAVALAAGSWLFGSLGAVFLQNSGLGNTINPLASLAIPYGIPVVLVISWRGEPGRPDAVHHYPMGAATPGILELFGIPYEILDTNSDLRAVADRVCRAAVEGRKPAAIIVPQGVFPKHSPAATDRAYRAEVTPRVGPRSFAGGTLPTRAEVTERLLAHAKGAAVVSTTGYASREVASFGDDHHFPMQGSMGFALSIGLGLARAQPSRRVLILDGDGAAIMRLGSLATCGFLKPRRLAHVVVDNGSYASTGGQATVSPGVDFASIALACGYRHAATCFGVEGLDAALAFLEETRDEGPTLLRILISSVESAPRGRPELAPPEIALRFRLAFEPAR